MWERVLQGTGQALGAPDFVTDYAAPRFDELGEGAHRGTLRLERWELVAMSEQQCELEGGVRGGVLGPARREGFAIPRLGEGIDREEDEKVVLAQGGANGT